MKKLVLALTLLAAQDLTLAATSLEERLAARFEGDRTGACVAAAVIDGPQVQRALFCARAQDQSRLDQAFEIGSVTKTMTAFLVADLIRQGRWSLDDPLAKHLPAGTVLPRQGERQILLRDVLSHSAGLPALPARLRPANPADPYATLSEADLLASLADVKLGPPIGSQAAYSNFGVMLVSLAVARAYGSDFETALRERLFQPLQMDGAFIATPGPKAAPATGHLPTGALTAAWTIPVNLAGVGMVKATLDDMVRYAQAQLGSDERMRLTQQPLAHGFGMGWALANVKGHRLVLHEGGTGGFSSLIALEPERQRAVLLLADAALSDLGGLGDLGLALLGAEVPVQGSRRVTAAPAALRQALLGDFDLAGLPMRIFEQGDRLLLQAQGQPAFELQHDSRGDFYPMAFSALLTPIMVDGRIDRLAWRQGGGRVEAQRREVPK